MSFSTRLLLEVLGLILSSHLCHRLKNFSTASDNLSVNYSRSQLIKDKIRGKSNDKTASRLDS